jgi:excisionase family DNA binding protein
MEDLLRKRDVVKKCRIAPRTLDGWIKRKRIPYVKFGKLIRFIPADIDKFIETCRIRGRAM